MTNNSKICQIIASVNNSGYAKGYGYNAEWMSILENDHHGINIKDDWPLAIFNYGIGADFSDPIIQEARGIIINMETAEVVCWPFRKFGKYDEYYSDEIDWSTARVQEKIDGSIVKLWFDKLQNKWRFSTNSTIDANKALMSSYGSSDYLVSFQELIERADNYHDIRFDDLDKDNTYIFELVGPGNRVIIAYEKYHLYHIGTRSNITGEESKLFIGIQRPKEYRLSSLEDCVDYVTNTFNVDESGMIGSCDHEGFVVVDDNWHRIKIKSPIYMQLHGILNNGEPGKRALIKLLYDNKIDVRSISENYPSLAPIFKFYDYQVERFKYEANAIVEVARKVYDATDKDRKETALRIKDFKYAPLGFFAINNPIYGAKDIIEHFGFAKITKWIPDYDKTEFGCALSGLNIY